jgi:cell division protein FtsZ
MEFESYKENSIIKVIGVGGGGSNAVNHMYRLGIKGVEFVVCNTDWQALEASPVQTKIQLGPSLTEGRGAGSIPEVGRNAAIETIDDVKKILLENTKMVFITAGMGGGTGTGAAPIIAQAAKEMGILTVGIVTVPFLFEGKKRKIQADHGIEELKKNVDTLLIICNDKLREMYGNLRLGDAFGHADDILTTAAKGIAEIITVTGYINVDFEDVKTVMTNSGVAIMGSAVASGENRATRAVESALASPLLNDNNIKGARYILMNIASGTNEVTMDEIGSITDYIQDEAGLTADIIWGNCLDESLGDHVSVTIIATGFKTKEEQGIEAARNTKIVYSMDKDEKKVETKAPQFRQERVQENIEPTLVRKDAPEPIENDAERTFEFTFDNSVEPVEDKVEETPVAEEKTIYSLEEQPPTDLMDEQLRKSRDRISKLKALSYKLGNANISDLEKEPAYMRKNVKLDNVTPSNESEMSRFTLSNDEEKKTELRQNNSFLHDNVD